MTDNKVIGVVEIPKGSICKYEIDQVTGTTWLDRVLKLECPQNYGFITNTLAEDGDPLDVFILMDEPLVTGTYVELEVLGVIEMMDGGKMDHKIIAKPTNAPYVSKWAVDLRIEAIKDFLRDYKAKGIVKLGYTGDAQDAYRLIDEASVAYVQQDEGKIVKFTRHSIYREEG